VIFVSSASSGDGGDGALHAAIGNDAHRIPISEVTLSMGAF
jgi:hypothetical protein